MKLGIMQPYFLPYIGYYQLINAVDLFIIYDNIKYTKKGWINRNRMLQNGKAAMFSLPLKSDSDYLDVRDRQLAATFDRDKLPNRFKEVYRRAPFFLQTFPLIEQVVHCKDTNLFRFLHHSIVETCKHLGIMTPIKVSSSIAMDHDLKNQDKVLAICGEVGARTYLNPIGGKEIYSKEDFSRQNIALQFISSKSCEYPQFGGEFVPWLSIVDMMMFNSLESLQNHFLNNFELL